jgi:hypothetical protein
VAKYSIPIIDPPGTNSIVDSVTAALNAVNAARAAAAKASANSAANSSSSGSGIKKSDDRPKISALSSLTKAGLKHQLNIKLGNIGLQYKQLDADILKSYGERTTQLGKSVSDNDKAESAASFANLVNSAREHADIQSQAAVQGAGESDVLRAQMMALRNLQANQMDVNRSFYDTQRAGNSAIIDLNSDTRTARVNLAQQTLSDKEQVTNSYYDQMSDAYTQMGNIQGDPYSNAYKKNSSAYAKMAKNASSAYKSKGISPDVTGWQGSLQPTEQHLNNSLIESATYNMAPKKPEGATLRAWE